MSECKTCYKDSKEHSKSLWQLHQEAKLCLLCNKNSGKHNEKLWTMHQNTLMRESRGEKLRPVTIGFGPTVVARTPVKNDPLYPPLEVSSLPVPIKLVPISKTPDRLNAIKKNT